MSRQKKVIRFTSDYIKNKDVIENPPKFLDNKNFKKELKRVLQEDADLMRKLADK